MAHVTRTFFIKLGQRGFTVMEVMIAGAIGSVMMLAMAQSMSQQSKMTKRMTLYSDWKNLLQLMRTTYANSEQCTNMFAGIVYNDVAANPAPGPSAYNLQQLGTRQSSSTPLQTIFLDTKNPNQGIQATSISINPVPLVSTQNGIYKGQNVKMDRVYLRILAKRVLSGISATGQAGGVSADLLSGNSAGDPDTIQLTFYKNPADNRVLGCSTNGNFDPASKFSGWTDKNDSSQCKVITAKIRNNMPLDVSCDPGSYAISYRTVPQVGDVKVPVPHQCYGGEFVYANSCHCLGSPYSCCAGPCSGRMDAGTEPMVTVPQLTCCAVRS